MYFCIFTTHPPTHPSVQPLFTARLPPVNTRRHERARTETVPARARRGCVEAAVGVAALSV